MQRSFEIQTPRLLLVGADSTLLSAELASHASLAAAIGASVPPSWPPEHHDTAVIQWVLKAQERLSSAEPWQLYYMVLRTSHTVVGTCGFKGPPDSSGNVEVGYSVVAEFRGAGLATEAVRNMIATAFEHGALGVAAETYPSLVPSLRVMIKCGMKHVGQGAEPGIVRYLVKRD
jgi:RimJ/RimL family protein N-acetyltransferase